VVDSGLNPGDRVIVQGTEKVHPGATVKAVAAQLPAALASAAAQGIQAASGAQTAQVAAAASGAQ
jgi:membrane fusion protein (multidrug efflux system)